MPDPIHLLSAGSLRHALPAIIAEFTDAGSAPVALTLGPAGLLRERIEAGEAFDLFISADMGHPRRLARLSIAEAPVRLVRNRLCALARADLRLTQADFLGILSDPAIRIGTSTPGADPCGDYAARMFDMIEAHHPGIGAGMRARAQHLLGGRDSPAGKDGASLIADGAVDVFLGYFTSARFHADDPAFGHRGNSRRMVPQRRIRPCDAPGCGNRRHEVPGLPAVAPGTRAVSGCGVRSVIIGLVTGVRFHCPCLP